MNINKLKIKMVKNFTYEILNKSHSKYTNYRIFDQYKINDTLYYNINNYTIDPLRNDPLCYISFNQNGTNYWLYDDDEKGLIFTPLQRNYSGFTTYVPPTVFFIAYLEIPYFILYKSNGIGKQNVKYVKYKESDNDIFIKYVDNAKKATMFNYDIVKWTDIINILPYSLLDDKYKI